MNCNMIQDLLPLYIDGLTSKESNKVIEKHLKTCDECRTAYREMKGEISQAAPITDEEIEDIELIKKIKSRNRKKVIGWGIGGIVVLLIIVMMILPRTYSQVKYEDVKLTYGVKGEYAFLTIEPKPGYDIVVSGSGGGKKSYLKMLSIKKGFGYGTGTMGWESELGSEEHPCQWTIEFEDKVIIFENGKLVEEKDK